LQADRHGDEGVVPRLDAELERDLPGLERKWLARFLERPGQLEGQAGGAVAAVAPEGLDNAHMLLGGGDEKCPQPARRHQQAEEKGELPRQGGQGWQAGHASPSVFASLLISCNGVSGFPNLP